MPCLRTRHSDTLLLSYYLLAAVLPPDVLYSPTALPHWLSSLSWWRSLLPKLGCCFTLWCCDKPAAVYDIGMYCVHFHYETPLCHYVQWLYIDLHSTHCVVIRKEKLNQSLITIMKGRRYFTTPVRRCQWLLLMFLPWRWRLLIFTCNPCVHCIL